MIIRKRSVYESGQVLILIAALMIGLVAMVGLAVDGGGVYFLNRDLQNAVDAGVIAATYAKCTGGDVNFAATQAIHDNGFVPGGPDNVVITVNNPPATGPGAGDDSYVEVIVQAEKPSFFIQVVNDEALLVSARGVGHCKGGPTNSAGAAIFAGCIGTDEGVKINASNSCSGKIIGGIHSNSGATSNGGLCVEGEVSTSGDGTQLKGTANGEDLPGAANQGVPTKDFPVFWNIQEFDDVNDKYPKLVTSYGIENYVKNPPGKTISLSPDLGLGTAGLDASTEPVLLYVDGDVTLKADNRLAKGTPLYLTIVATGKIDIKGSFDELNWYNAGEHPSFAGGDNPFGFLLIFSNYVSSSGNCKAVSSADGINFSGNKLWFKGILYAPTADVAASVSNAHAPVLGAVFAQTVSLTLSATTWVYDPTWLPPDPPSIGIAE